ncbi:DUF7230 family protein [Balneatrix alpica]|uniref:Uncharacterized protein n=1 Tax=Balneatrix alpica TaxID=75684 RepID=A0ABV5ZFU9_9GAMM|nr:hypothetical protein [Balneatrix alpica]
MAHKKRSKQAQTSAVVVNNLVAKYAEQFNQARTFIDRKKAAKAGKHKHKGREWPEQIGLQAA